MRTRIGRCIVLVIASFATGCSGAGGGASNGAPDAGNLAVCAPTLAAYCAQAGSVCATRWAQAQSVTGNLACSGGLYLYACNGLDVASCPGDEGGGHTLVFDPTSHALVAAVAYPSIVPGGNQGCYVGPESLRASLQSGPPGCPTGPLLGPTGPTISSGDGGDGGD